MMDKINTVNTLYTVITMTNDLSRLEQSMIIISRPLYYYMKLNQIFTLLTIILTTFVNIILYIID